MLGHWVDRYPRYVLLRYIEVSLCVLAVLAWALIRSERTALMLALLLVVLLLDSSLATLSDIVTVSLIQDLVPAENRTNARYVGRLTFQFASLVGALVAAYFVESNANTQAKASLLNAASFLPIVCFYWFSRNIRKTTNTQVKKAVPNEEVTLREAWRNLRGRRDAYLSFWIWVGITVATSGSWTLYPVLADRSLGGGSAYPFMVMASMAGCVTIVLLQSLRKTQPATLKRIIVWSVQLLVFNVLYGTSGLFVAILGLFVAAFGINITSVLVAELVVDGATLPASEETQGEEDVNPYVGRLNVIITLGWNVATLVGNLLAALLIQGWTPRFAAIIPSLLGLMGVGFIWTIVCRHRR